MRFLHSSLIVVLAVGCGSPSVPTKGGALAVNNQLHAFFETRDGQLDLVIFIPAKLNREFASGTTSSTTDSWGREKFEGSYRCKDGFALKYSCAAAAGTMAINAVDYSLAKGRVFLCRREGTSLVVKQVDLPLSGGQSHEDIIRKLGSDQAVITQFFAAPDQAPVESGKNP